MKVEQTIYNIPIKEVTAKKYTELTGMNFETVKKFCRNGLLTGRKTVLTACVSS